MILYDKFMAEYRRILIRALASLHRDHLGLETSVRSLHGERGTTENGLGRLGCLAAKTGPRRSAVETSRARRPTLSNVALASLTCWHRASHVDDCLSPRDFTSHRREGTRKTAVYSDKYIGVVTGVG